MWGYHKHYTSAEDSSIKSTLVYLGSADDIPQSAENHPKYWWCPSTVLNILNSTDGIPTQHWSYPSIKAMAISLHSTESISPLDWWYPTAYPYGAYHDCPLANIYFPSNWHIGLCWEKNRLESWCRHEPLKWTRENIPLYRSIPWISWIWWWTMFANLTICIFT